MNIEHWPHRRMVNKAIAYIIVNIITFSKFKPLALLTYV